MERDILMVYMGVVVTGYSNISHMWKEVTREEVDAGQFDEQANRPAVYFEWKTRHKKNEIHSRVGPGGVYKASVNEGYYQWGGRLGMWGDPAQVSEWYTRHQAVLANKRAELALTNEETQNHLKKMLEPLRYTYSTLNGPQRAQLIANVVRYIVT